MSFRFFLMFLLLLPMACTENIQDGKEGTHGWNDIRELNILLKERKEQEAIGIVLQKIYDLRKDTVQTVTDNTQIEYARLLFGLLVDAYLNSRQFTAGIVCLDSLEKISFWKENYRYDFPVAKARLYQEMGNNRQAIQWAATYLDLPECTDVGRLISYSEIISEIYIYCNNDLAKAVRILEKAVEAYRGGSMHSNIVPAISRLSIYYRMMGEYGKAVTFGQEAVENCNDSIPPQDVVIAYGAQANLYKELGLYQQALQQNATALHYSLASDSFGLGDLYRYRAEIFSLTGNQDSVFHYLHLDEQVSMCLQNIKGIFLNRLAIMKACLENPDSLQRALNLGLSICSDTANIPKWAQYQLDFYLGQLMQKVGDTQHAIPLIERASAGFASIHKVEMEEKANRMLMDYYRQMKMDDTFMHYYNRNLLFADSLRADEKLRAVAAANIRFGAEREKENNVFLSAWMSIQRYQPYQNICIFLGLLMLIGGSAGYLIYKKKAVHSLMERGEKEIRRLMTSRQELDRRNAQLAEQMEQMKIDHNLTAVRQLSGQRLLNKEDENMFRKSFAVVHPSYLPNLREYYPQLTRNEELLAMLICMNQSTDEIALIMSINRSSVNMIRSRMRKKMGLLKEDSLDEILKGYLS